MGSLFRGKKESPEYETVYDPFSKIRGQTSDWLSGQIGKTGTPYTGELTSKMSEPEESSLDYLKKYTSQGTPEMTQLGQNEIKKTLTGEYDPTTSPYYQAVKAESARNLENTQKNIASNAGGGGRFYTGARVAEQGRAATDTGIGLNKELGAIAERERQNRLSAATTAAGMGETERNVPLQYAAASQQLGALPRNIQDVNKQAVYNEWLRQQEYPMQIAQMSAPYAGQQPIMAQAGYSPSIWSQISGAAGNLLGGTDWSNLFKKTAATKTA